jgi:hypothetical protein
VPIDDAGWHYDTCREHDLDEACAATHIGMFFAWLAHHGLANPDNVDITALLDRSVTPGSFLLQRCCGEIHGFMLTTRGWAFGKASYRAYLGMYRRIPEIAQYPVTYAAPDTWATYDAVAPTIQQAYDVFCAQTE